MKLNTFFYSIIALVILSSCAASKINKIAKQGSIAENDFKVTVPFEYRKGLIIL